MNIWLNIAVVGLVISGGGFFMSVFMEAINKYLQRKYRRETRILVLSLSIVVFLASYVLLRELMGK